MKTTLILALLLSGCMATSPRNISDADFEQSLRLIETLKRRPVPVAPVAPLGVTCVTRAVGNSLQTWCN